MKNISIFLIILAGFFLHSCEDITTEDVSDITYYVAYEIIGDRMTKIPLGTPYEEQGVIATEQGKDVANKVVTEGDNDVDTNTPGVYFVTYSAVNKDGFASSTTRTVIVYDPGFSGSNIAGIYQLEDGSRDLNGTITPYFGYEVEILEMAPGIFYVSDFFAGYYDKRAGYGPDYAATGYIQMQNDNTIQLLAGSYVAGWHDSLDDLRDGEYDPGTKSVTWIADYAGRMSFSVLLLPVE